MKTKIISFGNMKGGVGKSTLATIMATFLFNKGKKVLILDCDDFQKTIFKTREEELENNQNNNGFEIIATNSEDASDLIKNLENSFDYIFIDLPGNLKQKGVLELYTYVDYLFIPTRFTDDDLDAAFVFLNLINKHMLPIRKEAGLKTTIKGIAYMEDSKFKEFKNYLKFKNELSLNFLESNIPNSRILIRKKSTFNNLNYVTNAYNIGHFYKEIIKILENE